MLKKISLGLLFAGTVFSGALFSADNIAEEAGGMSYIPLDYTLAAGQKSDPITNKLGYTISIFCTLDPNRENSFLFEGIKGSGSVNGHYMSGVDKYTVKARTLCLISYGVSTVQVTNADTSTITVHCKFQKC